MTDTIKYELKDVCANVRTHIPDFDMATYIMSCVRIANNHDNMQSEIGGLHGTIKSQKQTHDAMIKKLTSLSAENERLRGALDLCRQELEVCMIAFNSIETLQTITTGGNVKDEKIKFMREIAKSKVKDINQALKDSALAREVGE